MVTDPSVFPRQDGIRGGVGPKPTRLNTVVVDDDDRVITVSVGAVVRVLFSATMTVSAAMRFGRFDGQEATLLCAGNDGAAALVNVEANNVTLDLEQPIDDWIPSAGDTLSLLWDARARLWRETGRASNG